MREIYKTQVRSLGWKDPLEKGMTTHSIILAWRFPWREEPGGGAAVHRVAESWTQLKRLGTHTRTHGFLKIFQEE